MTYQFLSERRLRLAKIFVVVLLAVCSLLLIAARSSAAARGTAIDGEWTARLDRGAADRININFSRRSDKDGYNNIGETLELTELQGLTRTTALSNANTTVTFNLVRE